MSIEKRIGFIFQVIIGVSVSIIAYFVESNIDGNSTYYYFIIFPALYHIIFIVILLIFLPQIIKLIKKAIKIISVECFVAYHLIFRTHVVMGVSVICVVTCFSISVGIFLQSLSVYGFSIVREVKYHKEIYRQTLVEHANELARDSNPQKSLPTLERIIHVFPDDERNRVAKKKIDAIRKYVRVSNEIFSRALVLENRKNLKRAIELYRTALEVWPHNTDAKNKLRQHFYRFNESKSSFYKLYDRCATGNFRDFTEDDARELEFIFRNPDYILNILRQEQADDNSRSVSRVVLSLCEKPLSIETNDLYYNYISNDLFGGVVDEFKR